MEQERPPPALRPQYFTGLVIDDQPELLRQSYALRYQVYCLERRFLPAADYPDQLETDAFDDHSIHLGVINTKGELVATARLVEPRTGHLPLFAHCRLYPGQRPLHGAGRQVIEISRLSVSRLYNRREGDEFYSQGGTSGPSDHRPDRRGGGEIVFSLYRAIYQVSKRRGFTHWLMAAEKALRRMVGKYGFPFKPIGPPSDYYGMVSPYIMALREFDAVIATGRIPILAEFFDGLEPQFRPAERAAPPGAGEVHEPARPGQ
jgi:N-acyl amino acid synthase of PEP-CTERM/exosortase system